MRFQNEQYVLFICRKAAKRNPKRLILNIPWLTEIKYLYNTHALKKLKLRLFNFIFKQRQCRKLHLSCEKGILLIGLFVRIISNAFMVISIRTFVRVFCTINILYIYILEINQTMHDWYQLHGPIYLKDPQKSNWFTETFVWVQLCV